jgi:shikimate kinase
MQPPRQYRNIALIGFMGTGKTTVGHHLATMLRFQFLDTDQWIEERCGQRIADIFAQKGEAEFRALEREAVAQLARHSRLVIATGGGLGANRENLASLKNHSLVVCLWASPEGIWQRVRHQSHRPLLHDPDPPAKIRQLLAERSPAYREADVLISTEIRTVREVASQIAHQFQLARRPS